MVFDVGNQIEPPSNVEVSKFQMLQKQDGATPVKTRNTKARQKIGSIGAYLSLSVETTYIYIYMYMHIQCIYIYTVYEYIYIYIYMYDLKWPKIHSPLEGPAPGGPPWPCFYDTYSKLTLVYL